MKPPLRYHMYSFRLQMGATAIIIIIIITGARAFMAVYMCSSWSLDSGLQPFKSLQQRIDTEEGRIICMKVKPHLSSTLSARSRKAGLGTCVSSLITWTIVCSAVSCIGPH